MGQFTITPHVVFIVIYFSKNYYNNPPLLGTSRKNLGYFASNDILQKDGDDINNLATLVFAPSQSQLQEWLRAKLASFSSIKVVFFLHILSPQIKVNLFHDSKLIARNSCEIMQPMPWKLFLKVSVAAFVRISK